MKTKLKTLILGSLLLMGYSQSVLADTPVAVSVSVSVDLTKPGPTIAQDYAGLSYETKREMPDEQGKYYFSPDNTALIKMFQTLGITNLRIGGNTVDSPKVAIPTNADIDYLFKFAQAAKTKVIYSFRLHNGDPQGSAAQAKYIADTYASSLVCFSIGNEPDIYIHSYPGLIKAFQPIYDAINQAVPGARYCGPSLTSNGVPWAHDFARDYGPSGKFVYITQHEYAGGAGGKVKDPVLGRDEMLSPAWHQIYETYYDKLVPPVLAAGMPYRLEEANNFYNGGAKDVSDTFASALWGLDYLYWYASHGSQGINFHNGDQVAAGQQLAPCRYASFTTVADGYFAHPLAYAIKMFNLGAPGGQIVPIDLVPDDSGKDINLVAYAVLGADQSLTITLINKEHGPSGRDAAVTLNTGGTFNQGQTLALLAPNGDVAAKDGITLGGHTIEHDGTWPEQWVPLDPAPAQGHALVKVPAASVLLVHFMAGPTAQ